MNAVASKGDNNNGDTAASMPPSKDEVLSKRRRELFGDCALIEIIHLHDCLRGALKALENDVNDLTCVLNERTSEKQQVSELERRVAGRFNVIWSVFRAHSSAEDEFIWPALQSKTQGRINGSHKYKSGEAWEPSSASESKMIEKVEYEEDHADEERMFSEMDRLLTKLRECMGQHEHFAKQPVDKVMRDIGEHTRALSKHLMDHLEKEETECMPLVAKHLTKQEIHDLVGQIMGKRSADTIAQIMTMAVQNLDEADRMDMVRYMKQAMSGTFFDRWLLMSGWMSSKGDEEDVEGRNNDEDKKRPAVELVIEEPEVDGQPKRVRIEDDDEEQCEEIKQGNFFGTDRRTTLSPSPTSQGLITSQAELEKFIRAIATNPGLTSEQKNATIQGLRDSVWKSNQKQFARAAESERPTVVNTAVHVPPTFSQAVGPTEAAATGLASTATSRTRRVTPPSMYFRKNSSGKIDLVWSSESPSSTHMTNSSVPLFSAAELAPSYHDGAAGSVLGCPHYARACKLRHPKSGRLYNCRLCCQQESELPTKDKDEPLDRYAVTEVMCMKCQALQPAEDRCINHDCESRGKPFAKYFCRICHLYDDATDKSIFHCPYCNCCRLGQGLGIDFRHCMVSFEQGVAFVLRSLHRLTLGSGNQRCNACVSLNDDEHQCIPQKLQGSCPICHESLFQSTEPLKGLNCGHVMHLSCFTEYRRGHSYTCPLCMRSMEDMKGKSNAGPHPSQPLNHSNTFVFFQIISPCWMQL